MYFWRTHHVSEPHPALALHHIHQQVVIEQSTPYVVLDRVDLLYFGKGSKGGKGAILI